MGNAVRWKQRFENFERAFLLLKEALVRNISQRYFVALEQVFTWLKQRSLE